MTDPIFSMLTRLISALVPPVIRRWVRRRQAVRQIEQLRHQVESCGAFYVADAHGGPVRVRQLPTDATALIATLHTDGFLTDEVMSLLYAFFDPAQQANALMTAPPQGGPPMLNEARRMASLIQGRGLVQNRDGNGLTVYERVKAGLAEALTRISRRPL